MAQRHEVAGGSPEALRALQEIPNVGPAIADDLVRLGITALEDLEGQDPSRLYLRLCALDGVRHDPCVLDTFSAIVSYANGEPPEPWWVFSRRRKQREREDKRSQRDSVP